MTVSDLTELNGAKIRFAYLKHSNFRTIKAVISFPSFIMIQSGWDSWHCVWLFVYIRQIEGETFYKQDNAQTLLIFDCKKMREAKKK